MANVLAWLTGREDRTEDPWPFQPQAELRTFNPPPSERFAHWVSGALGAGPGASLARQRFAEGVPSVLSLFPPLGAGLSAADLLHAKAAGDPLGVAAAAIGMVPGARPAGQAVKAGENAIAQGVDELFASIKNKTAPLFQSKIDPTEHALGAIGAALDNKAAFSVYDKANGLHHVFDAQTGKLAGSSKSKSWADDFEKQWGTLDPKVQQFHMQDAAKNPTLAPSPTAAPANPEKETWIAGNNTAGGPKNIPINQISTPSPKEIKAPDLLEAQKRYEEAIAPLFQNLPPRAVEQGYTTPAFRGLKIREGDVAPVHNFDKAEHQYATANPMLADMYADYLSKHPGWQVPGEAFDKGASVAPLLLDTSKYHYYDAAGAHWSSSAGNKRGISQAREKGAPGVIVDNVWDEPNSTHALGTPSKIFITFPSGASTVKSRFAERFDPSSPDMLKNFAALTAGGTGIAALLGSDRAEAKAPQRAQAVPPVPLSDRITQIIDSLDWQDQWMGRMRLPLKRKAE